ncbi:baculo_p74_N domain-containing protein [Caerostris darwini]|uniref:Baculo_p74_N domain-containing protein n=1 Tax=Caerostris darwini TaxID=1538125 RepID=A0AAV4T3V9_9ARAC|nr:baculo_p74_N domain-containing protein [Caerostris darwini]
MKTYDIINAEMYAENLTKEYQYNKFLKSHPHIFRHCNVESRPATNSDYYIPPAIADKCKVFNVTFNKIGCEKIACFPKMKNLEDCNPKDVTKIIPLGTGFTYACQPACSQISLDIDVEFRDEKCLRVNTFKKMFALIPEQIFKIKTLHPLHNGLNLVNNYLELNENYCKYYGLQFNSHTRECYETVGQQVVEILLGSAVYRSIIRSSNNQKQHQLNVNIPNYLKNVNGWLEGTKIRKKRNDIANISKDIAIDLAADMTIDFNIRQATKILQKRIPTSIATIKNLNPVTKSALLNVLYKSHLNSAMQVSKMTGTTLKLSGSIYSIYGLITMVIDVFDPFNFNYVLDRKTLDKVNDNFDLEFFKSNITEVVVTPEDICYILEEDFRDLDLDLDREVDFVLDKDLDLDREVDFALDLGVEVDLDLLNGGLESAFGRASKLDKVSPTLKILSKLLFNSISSPHESLK